MAGLKTFDAFPKTEERHVKKSVNGGLSSILTYFMLLLIAWTEFGSYFGGYIDEQYSVDPTIRETVQINMDMYIKMPCQLIHVNAMDETMDRKFVSNELIFEDMPFFVPYGTKVNNKNDIVSPGLDEIIGEAIPAEFREKLDFKSQVDADGNPLFKVDGCHIYGSVKLNRVAGELQFTAKGWGYRDNGRAPLDQIDFNHVINEFSFGDFYPYIDNPLDGTAKIEKQKSISRYIYSTSVVPTIFQKLGAEVDTNQYSLAEYHTAPKDGKIKLTTSIPGIFFRYDFEPLSIVISDKRLSFVQFIVRLVAILSFILYMASWLFRGTDFLLVNTLGPKWSLRFQPTMDNNGLLS
ncbi:hypothetical protein Kpol_1001p9 [Vanderwaltozyma polyspora DSM 70294]|uniref:Endoplasmic reticulum-Golgi intermediate compartment protein n=1 Tax=Vanderwaltozyma polyspora (strain ATCC 22028 / DSM 70294 / BCRC 21397 / CBS 2163 / NBRC 10782 / NRRL Y-8283 / UCD 57-17) TaxID=436907 RepID=A7TNP6_VANPO|nr:uncharacterized protein Kpol_1001p9 [Vanderwaltozyma polyspora DSM 70294]EDO16097.1 hypothetical protein Kpol_1001p9 [Vanderwaltozyma polyspora DSM 70294]